MKTKGNVSIEDFRLADGPVLDVRSPVEFDKGHIPGALNFPLFSDEERSEIGICFKKQGRESAVALGFDLLGPRLGDLIRRAREIAPDKAVRIHCWRGGMRSRSVAWCLEATGMRVVTLDGGYKSYRRWARKIVSSPRRMCVLGGLTGTGKTQILEGLQGQGNQTLDLEGLANHRGSSFGGLGLEPQPSTQHFENLIAEQLAKMDTSKPVWIESESGRIGDCWIPEELFHLMKMAPAIEIIRPIDERLDILTEMYGQCDREELVEATKRIAQQLGGERTKAAIDLIQQNELREACRLILDYYDRSYGANTKHRTESVPKVDVENLSAFDAATLLTERDQTFNSELARSAQP